MNNLIWVLAPIGIGLCQPIIWQMTLRLTKAAGDMPAAAILHAIGALMGGVFVLLGLKGGDGQWGNIPWWAWFGGVIGLLCLWMLNMSIPKIGIAPVMAILVASQLIAGLIFESHGLLGAQVRAIQSHHWLGVVLLSIGAYLVSRS